MDKYMEQAIRDLGAVYHDEDLVRRFQNNGGQIEFALKARASELRLLDMLRRINQECNCPFCEGPSVGVGHADFCELMKLLAQYKDVKTD